MEIAGSVKDPAGLPEADCQLLPHLLCHSADLPAPYSSRHFDSAFGELAVVAFVVVVAVAEGAALQPFLVEPSWQASAGLAYPVLATVAAEAEVVGLFSAAVEAFVVASGLAHLPVEAAAAAWAQLPPSFPEVLAAVPSALCSLMFVPARLFLVALPCQSQGGLLPSVPVAADGAAASCQLAQPAFEASEPVPSFAVHLPLAGSSWLSPQLQAEDLKVAVAGT